MRQTIADNRLVEDPVTIDKYGSEHEYIVAQAFTLPCPDCSRYSSRPHHFVGFCFSAG
jgi:hypothetical protein